MAQKYHIITIFIGVYSLSMCALTDMFSNALASQAQRGAYVFGGACVLGSAAYICGVKKSVLLGCMSGTCSYAILGGLGYAERHECPSWVVHAILPCLGAAICGGNRLHYNIKHKLYETPVLHDPDIRILDIGNLLFLPIIFALLGASVGMLPELSSSAALALCNKLHTKLTGVVP